MRSIKAYQSSPVGTTLTRISLEARSRAWRRYLSALWLPAVLALAVVVTRLPFRTSYLFNWDSANFALALKDFDVTRHAPHPPGYPYFVLVGKALYLFTPDANSALVLESIIISALAVVAVLKLGQVVYSQRVGIASAALLAGSVTFWTYGEVALAYTSLALFSTIVALFAYQIIFLKKDRGIHLALAYAIAGGFRPDLLLFLSPLVAVSCTRLRRRQALVTLFLIAVGVLLWLIPTVQLSGGPESYLAVLKAYVSQDVIEKYSPTHIGLAALVVNVKDTASYLFYSLYAAFLLLLASMLGWARLYIERRRTGWMSWGKEGLVLMWLAPMLTFYLFVHIGDPGYVFSFLPAVLLLASKGLTALLESALGPRRGAIATAGALMIVLGLNAAVFAFHQRPLTAWGLRQSDVSVEAKLALLAAQDPQLQPLALFYDSFRHAQFYLPEYQRSKWIDTPSGVSQTTPIPAGTEKVLLMDNSLVTAGAGLRGETVEITQTHKVKVVPTAGAKVIKYDGRDLTLE